MNNSTIKIRQSDDIEGVAIAPGTLIQLSDGQFSYLPSFKIKTENWTWHGTINEASDEQARGDRLLVGDELADELGLEDGQQVSVGLSAMEPLKRIQIKAKKGNSPLPFVAGIQAKQGQLIRYEGKTHTIKATDPSAGYIDSNTIVEILGKKGEVEVHSSNTLKQKASAKVGKGFSQIIGQQDVIEQITRRIIQPFQNPEVSKRYLKSPLKGAILHGPYGIGKTALVRAIAEELGVPFYLIDNSVATSIYGPSRIQQTYKKAAAQPNGAIVFIDEIDAVAPRGWTGSPITSALQEAMDGLNRAMNVLTLAATNNLHDVAEGLLRPGRFDIIISMRLPSQQARGQLFAHFLKDVEVSPDVDVNKLADKTASFTGADIESVCKNAGAQALTSHVATGRDQQISQANLLAEIEAFSPTGARLLGVSRPKFSFDDMHGAEPLIQQIKRRLKLLSGSVSSEYASRKSAVILLHGPPGTGKTMIAQCMASYLGCNFKYKPATSFKNKYVGETEANIRKLFNTGRTYQPIVIFLDEVDAIGKTRSSNDPYTSAALNELLTELDGIADNSGVIVVAATNRKQDLDPALLSRVTCDFDMGLPDEGQRAEILRGLLQPLPVSSLDYRYLAQLTEGWSQRTLAGLKAELVDKLVLEEIIEVTTNVVEALIKEYSAYPSTQVSTNGRAL